MLGLIAVLASAAAGAAPIRLELPVACRLGETCFIQQYPDHDAGPGSKDYRCGPQSYDGHDGLDLRLPTLAAQRAGVAVLAAAAGTVKAARDGMADVSVEIAGPASVKDRECGNGVLVTHLGGWETQYCHMAKGSVAVKPGQAVTAGTPLGRIGESGDAAFPHLHLSVRHGAEKVDPFAWGAAPGACTGGTSLWSAAAARALAYRPAEVINQGFADAPVSMDDIEADNARAHAPGADPPALVAFVRAIGLRKDDVLVLALTGPGGFSASGAPTTLDHDKAQYMLFAGKKRPAPGWAHGRYAATFTVRRAGAVVLTRTFGMGL